MGKERRFRGSKPSPEYGTRNFRQDCDLARVSARRAMTELKRHLSVSGFRYPMDTRRRLWDVAEHLEAAFEVIGDESLVALTLLDSAHFGALAETGAADLASLDCRESARWIGPPLIANLSERDQRHAVLVLNSLGMWRSDLT